MEKKYFEIIHRIPCCDVTLVKVSIHHLAGSFDKWSWISNIQCCFSCRGVQGEGVNLRIPREDWGNGGLDSLRYPTPSCSFSREPYGTHHPPPLRIRVFNAMKIPTVWTWVGASSVEPKTVCFQVKHDEHVPFPIEEIETYMQIRDSLHQCWGTKN